MSFPLQIKFAQQENSVENFKNVFFECKMEQDCDYTFKVSITGDAGIGKTSLLVRFVDGEFSEELIANIGVEYKQKIITIKGKKVKVRIYDTAGQERFRTISANFYRGSHGAVLAFDVSDSRSFQSLEEWIKEIRSYTSGVPILLIGTKTDLQSRQVSIEEAKTFADSHGFLYFETSSKTGEGITETFDKLVEIILEEKGAFEEQKENPKETKSNKKKQKTCTCI